MEPVTVRRKRYVVPCVVCRGLYGAHRTNSRTCSTACRVRLHRGHVDTYELAAAGISRMLGGRVAPFDVRRIGAAKALRPDLAEKVDAGAIELDDLDVWPEYIEQLSAAAQAPPSCAAPSTASPEATP